MMETAQLRALLRADLWRLLALSLDRPTAGRIAEIAALARELRAALPSERDALGECLGELLAALRHCGADMLEQEYHQLFTTRMLVAPNESSYHRTNRGAVISDIAGFYAAFGLRLKPGEGAADSMRNELSFLCWMALKEAQAMTSRQPDAVEITRNATRAFLTDHIGRWAAAFAERLMGASPSPFYAAAGGLLIAAMNQATREFAVRDVAPLSTESAAREPDTIPCPAAGACTAAE